MSRVLGPGTCSKTRQATTIVEGAESYHKFIEDKYLHDSSFPVTLLNMALHTLHTTPNRYEIQKKKKKVRRVNASFMEWKSTTVTQIQKLHVAFSTRN